MAAIHRLTFGSRVLLYRDTDEEYVARALELDLIGYGESPNKALADLKNAMAAQLSFALQMDALDTIYHPAPKKEFARWEKANRNALADLARDDVSMKASGEACYIEFSSAELKQLREMAAHKPFQARAFGNQCCHA